ncbi:MAG TPA: FG-GAP-like repeat-containing protein [Thermoanaerobaculia bacterium]|jgi:hypothetical protein
MKRILLTATLLLTAAAQAQFPVPPVRNVAQYRDGVLTPGVGTANLHADVDVTGDGVADIVGCAGNAAFVVARKGNGYGTAWYGPPEKCHAVTVGDTTNNGTMRVVVGSDDPGANNRTYVQYYNPASYQRDFYAGYTPAGMTGGVKDMAMANIDGDSDNEVLVLFENGLAVYNARTNLPDYQTDLLGGTALRVANVDDDPAPEIVINGPTGRIIDPGNWLAGREYPGGFGTAMKLGNVDGDAEAEIVFGSGTKVTIVNGDDLSSSFFNTPGTVTALTVADGKIAVGEPGLVSYYTPAGAKLWSVASPVSRITDISAGDVDGDGAIEIVFGAATDTAGLLAIASNGQVEKSFADERGPYVPDVADLDRDGRAEIIVGSSHAVRVLDYATREVKGRLALPAPAPNVLDLRIGQLDGDAALEIVVQGKRDGSPSGLSVFDGVTHALEWSSQPQGASTGYMAGTLHVKNVDSDAVDEIIVAYDSSVYVFNGASDAGLWISPAASTLIRTVTVGDVDLNNTVDIAATDQFGTTVYSRHFNTSRAVHVARFPNASAAGNGSLLVIDDQGYWTMFRSDSTQAWTQHYPNNFTRRRVSVETVLGKNFIFFYGSTYFGNFELYSVPVEAWQEPIAYRTGNGADIRHMRFASLPGSAQPLLLRGYVDGYEIDAADTKDTPRGDVNLDGTMTDVDLDALARYFFADGPGIPLAANVNGNLPIDGYDLFYLINYRKGTGPAPVP